MVYPTDEDPQDKVLVKAFNDRLKEQKHGKNMSDRIASRNRGTLPKTIYDFINQIVGEVTTLQHHQGNAAQWENEGRERNRGAYDDKGRGDHKDRYKTHSSRPDQGRKGKPHVECNGCGGQGHTWKECRNYKHELFNPEGTRTVPHNFDGRRGGEAVWQEKNLVKQDLMGQNRW